MNQIYLAISQVPGDSNEKSLDEFHQRNVLLFQGTIAVCQNFETCHQIGKQYILVITN